MTTFPPTRSRRVTTPWLIALLASCCAPLWAGGAGSSARLKLSDLQAIEGSVTSFAVSPDGTRVVYVADPEIIDTFGLFSVPADGGSILPLIVGANDLEREFLAISSDGAYAVVIGDLLSDARELYSVRVLGGAVMRINPPFPSGREVRRFVLAGARAIYWADQDTKGVEELYSVRISGGQAVKLSGVLASDAVQDDFQVSPDGSRVIYRAAQDTAGIHELYSAPADGSAAAVKLNGALASSEITEHWAISPDGTRVVYRAAQDTNNVFELYSVPIDGSAAATKISGPLVTDGDVSTRFLIDPSSSLVVYQADQEIDGVDDLYSVPLTGGTVTQLTDDAYVEGGALQDEAWTLSVQRVAFVADRDTDEVFELFTVPIGGGTVTKVSGPMVEQGDVLPSNDLAFTGDGERVLYIADQEQDGRIELFSSLAAGGGNVKLSGTLFSASGLGRFGTFGSSSVWYQAAQETLDEDLYRVPADLSSPAEKVNGPLPVGGRLQGTPTLTATQIFYLAEQDTLGVPELFVADQTGGAAIKINGPIVARGGWIDNVLPTPDGQRVVYRGRIENRVREELFSAELATGQVTKLSSVIARGDVSDEQLSSDGTRVVYRAPEDEREVDELYSVPSAGGAATRLNPTLVAGGLVRSLLASPSTDRVVYVADQETDNQLELYSVEIGGGPVVKLNEPLPFGGDVSSSGTAISPSGATTLYLADQNVDGIFEVFAVPTIGGQTVDLTSPLTSVDRARIAPDESRVVYVADEETESVFELYSVPLAGGASVKLNDPLPDGGRIEPGDDDVQITSDSAHVVFRAEQITDGVIELFSVPIVGGPVTRLNTDLPANADVDSFLLTPDGTRVVYRADQELHNLQELYSVPVTGGLPLKLNPPLPNDRDVLRYKVSPAGDRVAFNGDVETNGIAELFSVPVDGGIAVKLNGPLAGNGPVREEEFQFTPDGRWVVYKAAQDTPGVDELYWVRATGGTTTKVNGPLAPGGSIRELWMAADSASVFYTADEEVSGIRDLWLGRPLVFADGFESGDTSAWSVTESP